MCCMHPARGRGSVVQRIALLSRLHKLLFAPTASRQPFNRSASRKCSSRRGMGLTCSHHYVAREACAI